MFLIFQLRSLSKDLVVDPSHWLHVAIEEHEKTGDVHLKLPKFSRNNESDNYTIDLLHDDQQAVVTIVMDKLRDFMTSESLSEFRPLRLTVRGAGGTGKSVIINTIVTLMRLMFNSNDVVQVAAPTGTAAFNVGGVTLHHLTKSGVSKDDCIPNAMKGSKKKKALLHKFANLLALIIDERSLINLKDLGTTCQVLSETALNGAFQAIPFGSIPIVVLFGDDYQLPSTSHGAFQCSGVDLSKAGAMTLLGRQAMLECASSTIELTSNKRLQDSQLDDRKIVDAVRLQQDLSEQQSAKLLSIGLKSYEHRNGRAARKQLEQESIFLFYTNEKRIRHNLRKLADHSSASNPVAFIQSMTYSCVTGKSDSRHWHQDDDPPGTCMLAIGAVVALTFRNFNPKWGLHNGACGMVNEIVFSKGKSPNGGDLPEYVVVDFPLYCGPTWDANNPTHVPIPVISRQCNKHCCTRKFVPLTLSWARTIHKFQGMSAGPVDKGKFPNMFNSIICDPGKREDERTALGLFYTALSRATTLGNEHGNGSAIYFFGQDFNEGRFRNLARKQNTFQDYKRAALRDKWIALLDLKRIRKMPSKRTQRNVLNWSSAARFTLDGLCLRIEKLSTEMIKPQL